MNSAFELFLKFKEMRTSQIPAMTFIINQFGCINSTYNKAVCNCNIDHYTF